MKNRERDTDRDRDRGKEGASERGRERERERERGQEREREGLRKKERGLRFCRWGRVARGRVVVCVGVCRGMWCIRRLSAGVFEGLYVVCVCVCVCVCVFVQVCMRTALVFR